MNTSDFAPNNGAVLGPPGRRTVLDDAHVGDIRGAGHPQSQHAHAHAPANIPTGCWQ